MYFIRGKIMENIIDELTLKVEGLQFVVKGLENLASYPNADMTRDDLRNECSTFCWLAYNTLKEMHEMIQGVRA